MCAPYEVCLLVRVQVVSGLGISCTVISRLMMSRAWLKSTQVTGMQLSAIKRLTLGAVGTVLLFFCNGDCGLHARTSDSSGSRPASRDVTGSQSHLL